MSKPLVSDDLWATIEPLLPFEPPKPKGGRPRCDGRLALAGIIFVLRSGIPWEMLPRESGCSGMTCRRRLHERQEAGVRAKLHRVLARRCAGRAARPRPDPQAAQEAPCRQGLRPPSLPQGVPVGPSHGRSWQGHPDGTIARSDCGASCEDRRRLGRRAHAGRRAAHEGCRSPGELGCAHGPALSFLHVPELDKDLDPRFRVGAAVEGRELAGLDLGDVVAVLHGAAIVEEYQGPVGMAVEEAQQLSQGDVVRVREAEGCRVDGLDLIEHLGYSCFQQFESYGTVKEHQALSVFAALSQETRLRIVRLLVVAGNDGLAAGSIAGQIGTAASTMSFHLKELEQAGLVRSRRESRSIIYTAEYDALSGLIRFLMEDCCSGRREVCEPALAVAASCCASNTSRLSS